MYLSNLCTSLLRRFERTGRIVDLDEAVGAGRRAIAAAPVGDPGRAVYLSNLGIALSARFKRIGSGADLDGAVETGQQAVAATPADHPLRAGRLSNLGNALQDRFARTGSDKDLDETVEAARLAVAATPSDHPNRAMYLCNLGIALQWRFERAGNSRDLDGAVDAGRQAVAATPLDHPNRATMLSSLGNALHTRFDRTSNSRDLDGAVDAGRQAVAATPADHPQRANCLSILANALLARFERTGSGADLDGAVEAGRRGASVEGASPQVRMLAARGWGLAAAAGGRWVEAVAGFEAAVGRVGRVAPRSVARPDQEHLLEEVSGLGADAAACCVRAGLAGRAVELCEQARGVLLGQALDTRTDLTALAQAHPTLADRFTGLAAELDRAGDRPGHRALAWAGTEGMGAGTGLADATGARLREAAEAFEQLIGEIRRLPGFDRFLLPPPLTELQAIVGEVPVAVVIVSWLGSYALVVTASGVLEPLPLPEVSPDSVAAQVAEFLGTLQASSDPAADGAVRAVAEARLEGVLGWLWDAVAGPVLQNRLGLAGSPATGQRWPRLRWCVSGLLSFLPLHAAGHHHTCQQAAPATVMDRVVSSYTPTIRALGHTRRGRASDPGAPSHGGQSGRPMVVVAMPHTPGTSDLPAARAEAASLARRFAERATVLVGGDPDPDRNATRQTVSHALPAARWAHFACHAQANLTNPSASCLLLADGPLTVTDLARLRLDRTELAFLSACETAHPGGRLPDEAIHLASAFQLAGYRHVVATLWPIGDRIAASFAEDFYTAASLDQGTSDVAAAVHSVATRLRRRWQHRPSVWASHIHTGA
jgi:hypothetical protein